MFPPCVFVSRLLTFTSKWANGCTSWCHLFAVVPWTPTLHCLWATPPLPFPVPPLNFPPRPGTALLHCTACATFSLIQCRFSLIQVCTTWNRVAYDEFLWRGIFYAFWKIPNTVTMAHGKSSWLTEFKRLYYHTPKVRYFHPLAYAVISGCTSESSEKNGRALPCSLCGQRDPLTSPILFCLFVKKVLCFCQRFFSLSCC